VPSAVLECWRRLEHASFVFKAAAPRSLASTPGTTLLADTIERLRPLDDIAPLGTRDLGKCWWPCQQSELLEYGLPAG